MTITVEGADEDAAYDALKSFFEQICEIISYCVQVFEKSMVDINKKTKIIRIKLDIINNECYNLFR